MRTHLVDVECTYEPTRAQFRSAGRLACELPDPTAVYPTPAFGSFCSTGSAKGGDGPTLGEQTSDAARRIRRPDEADAVDSADRHHPRAQALRPARDVLNLILAGRA